MAKLTDSKPSSAYHLALLGDVGTTSNYTINIGCYPSGLKQPYNGGQNKGGNCCPYIICSIPGTNVSCPSGAYSNQKFEWTNNPAKYGYGGVYGTYQGQNGNGESIKNTLTLPTVKNCCQDKCTSCQDLGYNTYNCKSC
jgi:hypothetical protein